MVLPTRYLLFYFCVITVTHRDLSSVYFARTKATRTNSNGLRCAVNDCSYLANVGFPCSVCLAMGVRDGLSENNTLSANATLCHNDTSLMY